MLIEESSPPPTLTTQQTLQITSEPSGANVFVDGRYVGVTPMLDLKASLAARKVRVTLEGYQPYEQSLGTKDVGVANNGATIHAVLVAARAATGTLEVSSNPSGAAVYIDGKYIGVTPIDDYTLAGGSYNIGLKLAGYKDADTTLSVIAGQGDFTKHKSDSGCTKW